MRKIVLTLAAAFASVVTAAPASAVSVVFAAGETGLVNNGVLVQDFNGFASGAQIGPGTYAYSGDVPNQGKTPNGTTGNYAAIQAFGAYTVNLTTFAPVLSFLAGTIDAYNSVTLTLVNTLGTPGNQSYQTFTGSDLGTINADGRVTFDTGSATFLISAATFVSGQNSFEIEDVATAAPEPATWAMMILGFGFAGLGLRSRRRGKLALA